MTRKTSALIVLWILVTGLGFTAGQIIVWWLENDDYYLPLFLLLGFAISGALIGFGQWILFDVDLKLSWLWIPSTALGMPIGLLLGLYVDMLFLQSILAESFWLNIAVISLIAGAIAGILQWLFTGGKLVSGKWIFISAFSYLGIAFYFPTSDNPISIFKNEYWVLNIILSGILIGIFTGTISGLFISPKLGTQHIKDRFLNWRSIVFISLIVISSITSKLFLYDDGYGDYNNPFLFSNYSIEGYFEFDPSTILDSINKEKANLFTISSYETWDLDKTYYDSINLTQLDYLIIADYLSQEIWNESLDLDNWKVLGISFRNICNDGSKGFSSFDIVYYKEAGIKFWSKQYQVRIIEISSWDGFIRWGEATLSDAILPGWGMVDLRNHLVSADDALLIAERNGGKEVRQEANNACRVSVWFNNFSPINSHTNNNWLVEYELEGFSLYIDPFSGMVNTNTK